MFPDPPDYTPFAVPMQMKMLGTEKLVLGILVPDRYGTRKRKTQRPAGRPWTCSVSRLLQVVGYGLHVGGERRFMERAGSRLTSMAPARPR